MILELPPDAFLPVEPHPELVAAMKPTSADLVLAASAMGLLSDPDSRWFRPAVSA